MHAFRLGQLWFALRSGSGIFACPQRALGSNDSLNSKALKGSEKCQVVNLLFSCYLEIGKYQESGNLHLGDMKAESIIYLMWAIPGSISVMIQRDDFVILNVFSNCELTVICKTLFAVKHPFLIKTNMFCDTEMWLLVKDVGKMLAGADHSLLWTHSRLLCWMHNIGHESYFRSRFFRFALVWFAKDHG